MLRPYETIFWAIDQMHVLCALLCAPPIHVGSTMAASCTPQESDHVFVMALFFLERF